MRNVSVLLLAVAMMIVTACAGEGWSREELRVIRKVGEVMGVLTVDEAGDSLFLRRHCREIPVEALEGEDYKILASKMVATVTSPEQDGVGIAGPQVGISRRIVAVQRFDKEGEPFEVYPNIYITGHEGDLVPGPEGCLSVPGRRGDVLRYREIDIRYSLPAGGAFPARDTVEHVSGFTAVIFQHECDHLDGILYTDYSLQYSR